MRCPVCRFKDTKVVDSRVASDGLSIRRRRECEKCSYRFSTLEEVELLDITVIKRDGKIYQQEYKIGKPLDDVRIIGKADKNETGTTITFFPDPEIFSTLEFDFAVLKKRLQEIAFLNPSATIILKDEKNGKSETFHYSGGLIEFVSHINKSKPILHKPIYFKKQVDSNIV